MYILHTLTALLAFSSAPAIAAPSPHIETELVERDTTPLETRDSGFIADVTDLWKRKGGGGGGGKGGGGGSSSSSGGKGGGSSSSGSGSSSGSSSSAGRGSSSSSAGGQTKTGSGVTPRFGGSYAGGAKVPYTAGGRSASGISPVLLGAGVGAGVGIAAYPGFWPYGAYAYPYSHPYIYHNRTARRNSSATSTSSSATATPTATNAARAAPVQLQYRQDSGDQGVNVTMNVTCLCAQYSVCGCDDNNNSTFLDSIIGDGTNLNTSIVNFASINGTPTVVLNGTLPNGTTASGGTENANAAAANMIRNIGGYWVMVVIVGCTAFLI